MIGIIRQMNLTTGNRIALKKMTTYFNHPLPQIPWHDVKQWKISTRRYISSGYILLRRYISLIRHTKLTTGNRIALTKDDHTH